MVCPHCGLSLADANAQVCPRCGYTLYAPPAQMPEYGYAASPRSVPSQQEYASTPAPTSSAPDYFAQPPTQSSMPPNEPFYGQAAPPSYPPSSYPVYGPPGVPPAYPPGYSPYGPYGPYGQGAPVTTPFYGQAAPPSYPIYGPPMPGAYPPPGWPGVQPQPQRKRGNGLIIGLSIGIAAVILLASIAAVAVVQNARNSAAAIPVATPTQTAMATATATPSHRVVFQDPLTSNQYGWLVNDHCFFASGGYHIKDGWGCYAPAPNFDTFDVSVDVHQINGANNYPYSLLFRIDDNAHYYEFAVVSTGAWAVFKRDNDTYTRLVDYRDDFAIHTGLNMKNKLQVVGIGSHFQLFINDVQVGVANDDSYNTGRCGLAAGPNLEAVFTNMTIMTA